jgi:hypothetical protein
MGRAERAAHRLDAGAAARIVTGALRWDLNQEHGLMRKAILSLGVFALLSFGAFGCEQMHHHDSDSTMKMSSSMPCCSDACKKSATACCSTDAAGKASCANGGSCCIKK